jgi:AraC family transcriptional activator of pobA
MAKSKTPAKPLQCRYLYHQGVTGRSQSRTVRHTHPFWQIEVALAEGIEARAGAQRWMLDAEDVLIIPAHVPHGFRYREGSSWLSVKLAVEGRVANEARLTAASPTRNALRAALLSLLPPIGAASAHQREMLSGVLAAMVASVFEEVPAGVPVEAGLVADVRRYIERFGGKPVTVGEVAANLGYSIGHASSEFRRHAGVGLKEFLDRERARRAAEALKYSDLRVGEIAEELGFPDLFAFSRFFRRLTGKSPRAYRAQDGHA